MRLRCVYLHPDPAMRATRRGILTGDLRAILQEATASGASAFCVVPKRDLAAFDGVEDLVVRLTRPEDRDLTRLCLRRERIPLISASYSSAERLLQGLRSLQRNAHKQGVARVAFLIASEDLFATLWDGAGDSDGGARRMLVLERAPVLTSDEWEPQAPEWRKVVADDAVPAWLLAAFIGESDVAKEVRFRVMRAATSNLRVLILGETGTGKEVVAQQVHANSYRRTGPFVAVDCGAIPPELFESMMFGHMKGSFTGAYDDRIGYWEEADGGTLFLDEIGELPLAAQVKILRALETGTIRRIGGPLTRPDVRVIGATSRDLAAMVEAGTFRSELLHRLRGHTIRTPTLRSRPEDIPLLARSRWEALKNPRPLSDEVLGALAARAWPGNVRELFQRLEELHDLFGHGEIRLEHLDAIFAEDDERPIDQHVAPDVHSFADVRLRCYWHVAAAIDVLRAAQVPMREPMEGRNLTPQTFARIAVIEQRRVADLEQLCARLPLFHVRRAYNVVRACKNLLRTFAGAIVSQPEAALEFWRDSVAVEIEQAIDYLFTVLGELEAAS